MVRICVAPTRILLLVFILACHTPALRAQSVRVALPDTVTRETTLAIPVEIGDVSGLQVVAFNMIISFDSTLLAIDGINNAGLLSDGMILTTNSATRDRIVVAGAGATFLSGGGVLLELQARLVGTGRSDLRFERFTFNEGSPQSEIVNGSISNAGGTATDDEALLPLAFAIRANYPNPFSATTTVPFDLPSPALVSLEVYDLVGRRVAQTPPELMSPGYGRELTFSGRHLPAGPYLVRLIAELPEGRQTVSRLVTRLR